MTIKQFNVSTKTVEERAKVEFKVDKFPVTAKEPAPGQLAYLMASTGRGASGSDAVAGVINFMISVVDKEAASHLQSRLLDPDDNFEVEDIENILEWLVEEWTGNPTGEPSGSTSSPSTTGRSSTEPTPLLT